MKIKHYLAGFLILLTFLLVLTQTVSAKWVLVAGEYGSAYIEYDYETLCMHLHTPGYYDIFDNWHAAIDVYMYAYDGMDVFIDGVAHPAFGGAPM